MTPEEFVRRVREQVLDASVADTIATLEKPPGRRPAESVVAASAWYHRLNDEDRAHLHNAIAWAAHGAVFGFLAVLDGVRAIEATPEKGALTLTFRKGGAETLLNSPTGEMLHDILNVDYSGG